MRVFVKAVCPNCGHAQNILVKTETRYVSPEVVTCDCDDSDGCGEYFAFSVSFVPQVRTFKMTEQIEQPAG